jgi:hypothetical protein
MRRRLRSGRSCPAGASAPAASASLPGRSASRRARGLAAALLAALVAFAHAAPAAAPAAGLHPAAPAARGEIARVERYWTPARMRSTPPLDSLGRGGGALASASFALVAEPTVPPNAVNGRIFIRQGRERGYCSGTAIDSPSRRLVLTAGHCVNSGPHSFAGNRVWSRYLEFVPAYSNGVAPFGAFVARRNAVRALPHWVRAGNPDFDFGAVLTSPNAEGVNVADAVGGGVKIALDLSRRQQFRTFGYPRPSRRMQGCDSPYVGDDARTYRIPGPPTVAIRCHWAPGASGGGWLIEREAATEIDGLTSYGRPHDRVHSFGPYFSRRTLGHLVAGL